MRILFDLIGAQTDGSRTRGIGRYTRAFALELARQCEQDELAFALSENFPDAAAELRREFAAFTRAGFASYKTPQSARYAAQQSDPARRLGEAVVRRVIADAAPDVYFASSLFEAFPKDFAPFDLSRMPARVGAAIVYDFIPSLFPDLYLRDGAARRFTTEQLKATASADLLLAISESTRQDAIRLLGVAPEKVVNISGAADSSFAPAPRSRSDDDRLNRLGISKPFVFCASGDDPRKNVSAAVEAYARLAPANRDRFQLVLLVPFTAERKAKIRGVLSKAGVAEADVVLIDRVNDEDLVFLYSRCELFLFPSIYEGFGLPALEAMQCGAAVLVGDNSSLREIVDRADLRCDTKSPDAIAAAMGALLPDPGRLAAARDWGLERAKAFSWKTTASIALAALREANDRAAGARSGKPFRASLRLAEGFEAEAANILRGAQGAQTATEAADLILASCPRLYDGSRRRLLVDVTTIVANDKRTGIQRVVRNVVRELYRAESLDDVVPVAVRLDKGRLVSCESYVASETGVAQTVPDAEIEIASGDRLLMLDNSWEDFERFRPVFADIRAANGAIVSCIYDLIPQLYRGASVGNVPEVHLAWLEAALKGGDGMIAISRTVAEELCEFIVQRGLQTRPGLRIGWFRCGSDIAPAGAASASKELRSMFDAPSPVFLSVGTIEPRKGHAIALQAFEQVWSSGVDARLMFIGRPGWHVHTLLEAVKGHREFGRRLFWFENADDSDLAFAYGNCRAVLAPSYAEGFGLPIVEAAWYGKPVICSDIPVFREVGGDGAVYFRVNDPAALAEAVRELLDGRAKADPAKVLKPSWRDAALRIVDVVMRDEWMRTLP